MLIMHHHIFKNAGTTIDWILHRNFPRGVLHIEGEHAGARLSPAQIVAASKPYPHHSAITSHSCPLPAAESFWAQCHLTMLRDPIDRFYSIYKFERRRPEDLPSARNAKAMGFRDYCEWWLKDQDSLFSNWQTRCCTPQETPLSDRPNPGRVGWAADLEAAKSTVSQAALVGTLDDFDETMLVLESILREQGTSFDGTYLRKNTSPRESESEGSTDYLAELLGPSLKDRLLEANAMDYELLRTARRAVRKRFRNLEDAEQKLTEFRARCEALKDDPEARSLHLPGREVWIIAA